MGKEALVIGSNKAGIQTALDIADSGIKVHLVEISPFLGYPGFPDLPKHLENTHLLEVAKHPNIKIWTNTQITSVEGENGHYSVEIKQHPRYVDLAKCTACGDCVEVCPVTIPGTSHKAIYLDGQPGCMAISKVGRSPCASACPGEIHVQGYVALIAQGRFKEAVNLVRDAIPFPGICGRVCTHPCEINCRRSEIDQPVAIRLLKRFLADWDLKHGSNGDTKDFEQSDLKKGKVAVIGAGPGGMAAADRLARKGFQVTVYEKLPVIGGMMAIGIPEYRLPREVIAQEYQHILNLGVDVQLNTSIGPDGDHTLDELFEMDFQAVCLAIGAHRSQSLNISGEDLDGVVHGIELLKNINLSQQVDDSGYQTELDKVLRQGEKTRVGVLGGGNTAMDVSRALTRLGVKDVRILYRRTRAEMPALPEEIEETEYEGVSIDYLVSPVKVIGEDGRVTGLECIRMELGDMDESGRRRPVPIEGSEFIVPLDMVVLAIGQSPDLEILGEEHDFSLTWGDRIEVDETRYMTNRPGVFAVGDVVTRDNMAVIEAIGMGKKAAQAIEAYILGEKTDGQEDQIWPLPIADRELSEDELIPKLLTKVKTISKKRRISSFDEVELGYTEKQAIAEAQRCLACGLCSECMECVNVCKPGAIVHKQVETVQELEIGAIVWAEDIAKLKDRPWGSMVNVYQVATDHALNGSAAAAQVMKALKSEILPVNIKKKTLLLETPDRIGVIVCQCGGEISEIVDTEGLRDRAATWPGVIHAEEFPVSCSTEAVEGICNLVKNHELNKVVIAGCTCCTLDQVCDSCTYQRVRLKDNLGLFNPHECEAGVFYSSVFEHMPEVSFEFVNIREHCAWAHADNPLAATGRAISLVKAAISRISEPIIRSREQIAFGKGTLVIGNGESAMICRDFLSEMGVKATHLVKAPDGIWRKWGQYEVSHNGEFFKAPTMVLAPKNQQEAKRLKGAFTQEGNRFLQLFDGMNTSHSGVFFCDPKMIPEVVGAGAAAKAAAWFGRLERLIDPTIAVVDSARCRACGECVDLCEYGAPELVTVESHRFAWIDPVMCKGCGTCAAHCPSGAITAGYWTDHQLESALDAILIGGERE